MMAPSAGTLVSCHITITITKICLRPITYLSSYDSIGEKSGDGQGHSNRPAELTRGAGDRQAPHAT